MFYSFTNLFISAIGISVKSHIGVPLVDIVKTNIQIMVLSHE